MGELWDVAKVSAYLSVKKSTVYAMVERREIPHFRIGRLARFNPAEIEAWLLTKRVDDQLEHKAKRTARRHKGHANDGIQIVRSAIDDLNPRGYNCSGKSDSSIKASERR